MENWIDDLPACGKSGRGYQSNQRYTQGGGRREFHELEDRSFNVKLPDSKTGLYAVFDGHEGDCVANYAAQKVPAELLFDKNMGALSEAEVIEALRAAFKSVERGYFEQIDEVLVKRTNLQIQIPEGLSSMETCNKYPGLVHRLQELDAEIQGGTSAVIALVQNDKLYIANIGDSRALLCTKNEKGEYQVEQLSVDHNLDSDAELQRLANLGLDIVALQNINNIVNLETTRSLGDFRVKGGYKEYEILRPAASEPVIPEPYVREAIQIDDSFDFLALFSRGLYKAVEEISDSKDVNAFIISLVAYELNEQSSTEAAAQAVIDKICREHQDHFKRSHGTTCKEREDMTLLIRLFSAILRKKSTPITPPIHVSENGVRNTAVRSPDLMPVSIPFTRPQEPMFPHAKPPRLIMPNVRQRMPTIQSFSQPNSRVSTPVTLIQTAITPPVAFYRNLSHVSEGSQCISSASTKTPSTSTPAEFLGVPNYTSPGAGDLSAGATDFSAGAGDSSASSRCASPWATTVRPGMDNPPTIDVGNDIPDASELIQISKKPVDDLIIESVSNDVNSEPDKPEQKEKPAPAMQPAQEEKPKEQQQPDDDKVDPYIDFSDFIEKINREGGEEVVFAEFMR